MIDQVNELIDQKITDFSTEQSTGTYNLIQDTVSEAIKNNNQANLE